jgi:hypothetical protein
MGEVGLIFGLITTKSTDTPQQKRGIGTYVQHQRNRWRRHTSCPYSTDMKINDYTYIDAADLP